MSQKPTWTTHVHCQGPGCEKAANVNQPGEIRPGWLMVLQAPSPIEAAARMKEAGPRGLPPKKLAFCGFTCLYNWVAAYLPSKPSGKAKGE